MAKSRGIRQDGRSKKTDYIEGPFLALPYSLLDNTDFRKLSSAAKVVVLAVGSLWKGKGKTPNGTLAFGEEAGKAWGLSEKTTRRALREAEAAGLITKTKAASFTTKRRVAEWAISWQRIPAHDNLIPISKVNPSGKNAAVRGKNGRYEKIGIKTDEPPTANSTAVFGKRRAA